MGQNMYYFEGFKFIYGTCVIFALWDGCGFQMQLGAVSSRDVLSCWLRRTEPCAHEGILVYKTPWKLHALHCTNILKLLRYNYGGKLKNNIGLVPSRIGTSRLVVNRIYILWNLCLVCVYVSWYSVSLGPCKKIFIGI